MRDRSQFALLVAFVAGLAAATAQVPQAVDPDSPAIKDFNKNIADYLKLHKVAEGEVHRQKPTTSSEAIEHHEHHLAHRIRELRRDAAQGSIFTPVVAAEFRRLIGITMRGADATAIRQSLLRAAPVHIHPIQVNSHYPEGVPLESTPPSLLLNLPPLPHDLEYRVVGRDLVLRDIDANLVIDLIPNVIS